MDEYMLVDLAATQIDEVLGVGSTAINQAILALEGAFESKTRTRPSITSAGITISPHPDGGFRMEQPKYARHLKALPSNTTFDQFRQLCHQVAWLRQKLLDLASVASICSKITANSLSKMPFKLINNCVAYAHAVLNVCIRIHPRSVT